MKKDSKIIVPKKKEYIFFELYFGETLFEKGFQNYSSKKKGSFFLELYFGATFLKKDSKIMVPKKKGTIYFFLNHILVQHF